VEAVTFQDISAKEFLSDLSHVKFGGLQFSQVPHFGGGSVGFNFGGLLPFIVVDTVSIQ